MLQKEHLTYSLWQNHLNHRKNLNLPFEMESDLLKSTSKARFSFTCDASYDS